jgi:F plasmid transfer operon protein
MTKSKINLLIFLLLALQMVPPLTLAQNSFFEQKYRGWLWFEDKISNVDQHTRQNLTEWEVADDGITAEAARIEVEAIKKELEDLHYIYLARPNFKTQKAYRDKLGEVMDRGLQLQQLWDEQNFIEPQYRDLVNSPENVFAVKLNRKLKAETDAETIKKFAKDYELVFFFRKSCPRSSEFEPVLKTFSDRNAVKVEAISIDGSTSEYFKLSSTISTKLIDKLGITATPTVIAVRKDASRAFELIRGFVTLSELEENAIKAWQLIEEKGINVGMRK